MPGLHEFHAVFHAVVAGEDGIRYGDLADKYRSRVLRRTRAALKTLLEGLVKRGALLCEKRGRSWWYRPGPEARDLLLSVTLPNAGGIRYRAEHVLRLLAFLAEGATGRGAQGALTDRIDLGEVVRALAKKTATGLVTLAELRRQTGLDRAPLHAAIKKRVAAGELLLHPIAARHQATAREMADGIKTPGGQNLFYVELA